MKLNEIRTRTRTHTATRTCKSTRSLGHEHRKPHMHGILHISFTVPPRFLAIPTKYFTKQLYICFIRLNAIIIVNGAASSSIARQSIYIYIYMLSAYFLLFNLPPRSLSSMLFTSGRFSNSIIILIFINVVLVHAVKHTVSGLRTAAVGHSLDSLDCGQAVEHTVSGLRHARIAQMNCPIISNDSFDFKIDGHKKNRTTSDESQNGDVWLKNKLVFILSVLHAHTPIDQYML